MAKPKKSPYYRGSKKHYAELGKKSASSRIKRHIECQAIRQLDLVTTFPVRKRESDAGYDVTSPVHARIAPGKRETIDLGLKVRCPKGYFYELRGRSSLNLQGVEVVDNVIDATYTGPLKVILCNNGKDPFVVKVGDRIAQLIFLPQIHVKFQPVELFVAEPGDRGEAGFGSSGRA